VCSLFGVKSFFFSCWQRGKSDQAKKAKDEKELSRARLKKKRHAYEACEEEPRHWVKAASGLLL
jgi:hypothetical protein